MTKQVLTGLVGWRGMVGSVLLERMQAEGDFELIEPVFFSTSNAGGAAPAQAKNETKLLRRLRHRRAEALRDHHHRAGRRVHQEGLSRSCAPPAGRATGSTPRRRCACRTTRSSSSTRSTCPSSRTRCKRGVRDYIGGNCTVSCMLMGVGALFKADLVEWMTLHHLPGGLGRRRAAHARAADAVRHAQRRGARRCSTTRPRRSWRSTARCGRAQRALSARRDRPTSACRWAAA